MPSKYYPFLTVSRREIRAPDILFITVPPNQALKASNWPPDIFPVAYDQSPNTGLAFLATQILKRTQYIPAIYYAHQVRARGKNNSDKKIDYLLGVEDAARLCIDSGASIVGLSLMSPLELEYARRFIEKTQKITALSGEEPPKFIAGGAQATLDRNRTSEKLGIPLQNVIPGRALPWLLQIMDEVLGGTSNLHDIDYTDPVKTDFLQIPGLLSMGLLNSPMINVLSSGGRGCIGDQSCSFCTAYFLGEQVFVSDENFRSQIDALSKEGIKQVWAGDNVINLARADMRKIFLSRVKYAYDTHVPIRHFLSRPDFVARAPLKYLTELNRFSIGSVLLGIESGDLRTLLEMRKIYGTKTSARRYLDFCRIAAGKLFKAGIKPTFSIIVGYPVQGVNGMNADRASLAILRELMVITKQRSKIDLNLLYPAPGSGIYADLLKRGATPDAIDKYNQANDEKLRRFQQKIKIDEGLEIEEIIAKWDKQMVSRILLFFNRRLNALNRLLHQNMRYHS